MLKRFFSLVVLLVLLAFSPAGMAQTVMISEFMADNLTSNFRDEDGERQDWLELQNMSGTAVSLNGWYLTDDASDLRKWRFPATAPAVNLAAGGRLVVWCSGKNRKASVSRLHTNFKLDKDGEYLALVRPDGLTVEHSFGTKYPPQFLNGTYGVVVQYDTTILLPETAEGKAHVPQSQADYTTAMAGWNSNVNFDDSGWQSGQAGFGYGPYFAGQIGPGGNVAAIMENVNASLCVRFKFEVPDRSAAAAVRLLVKYDDGFACFLNGTRIANGLAPSELTWDSTNLLQIPRPDSSGLNLEPVSTPNALAALVQGTNVLAFQLLNTAKNDPNTILRPQFEMDVATGLTTGYLVSATPGAANSAQATAIGPAIDQVTKNPARPVGGAGSAPIVVTAKVTPTLRPLATSNPVVLKWRRMYSAESSINMTFSAATGLYSASIPTTSLLPGEMIRWRVEARDNGATPTYSYAPEYPFGATTPPGNSPPTSLTADLDQYYGTVAQDTITTSRLPILHWFAATPANADGTTGESCSIFFQPIAKLPEGTPGYTPPEPRFYDNIPIYRHGQSTSGGAFPQKSHNISFNKENRFKWKDGEPAVRGVNLLTTWADKSKLRHALAYDTWEKSGHLASHFAQTVRVQQNGTFRGLYELVEDGNEDFIDREGLDPLGSLYKVYNDLRDANVAVNNANGSEKKNPDTSDFSDLQAFVAGISDSQAMTTRLRYAYDNVDIASAINFLAVHTVIMNRDFGHKNYYVYRDTAKTGEWSPLPWDQDLSFGHTWTSAQNYFDDDIHSQGPLQLGTGNRLNQIIFGSPELNAMFVARVRSLANQFLVSASETNGPLEQKINELLDRLDPNPDNPGGGTDDADLAARQWGFWVDGSSATINYTDSRMAEHTVRAQAARILSSNPVPPYPGQNPYANWGDGSTSLLPFLPGRRAFMFANPAPRSGTLSVPATAPANPTLVIEGIDFNPAAGTQDQEFFIIRNPNNYAVDISGWQLSGEVSMTFRGGTIIPGVGTPTLQGTNSAYVNQLIVARKPLGFRQRTVSPRANEYRQVSGPYKGQLSARGGPIVLSRPNNLFDPTAGYTQIATTTYAGAPSQSQQFLRISELHYDPAEPTTAESEVLPGVSPSDFEFIEILNTGTSNLNLANARFDRGVEFVFPNGAVSTLAPGARRLIVSNLTAFRVRYGTEYDALILGEYLGNLNNAGEELQLLDPTGEVVLEFDYLKTWHPLTAGGGRSLEAISFAHTSYGTSEAWRPSLGNGGSPGYEDTIPAISGHPAGRVVNPGEDVTLSVTAAGPPAPSYQWRKDGEDIPGATAASLVIDDITEEGEGVYDVVATNVAGYATSSPATLLVNDPVVITAQPNGATVNPGTGVTLQVGATGTAPLTYQWRKNGQDLTGANGPALELAGQESDEGLYDVIVSNIVGPEPSAAVAFVVNDPVVFTGHPETKAVNPGDNVILTATATGTGPFSYQWRKGEEDLEGETGPTLEFTASEDKEGSYSVVVTNIVGSVPSAAGVLTVNDPVVFTTQPEDATVNPGEGVTLRVVVTGTGPFAYQWRKAAVPGNGSAASTVPAPIPGAEGDTFEIPAASENDESIYTVVVTNPVGAFTSAEAAVMVNDPVKILAQPRPVSIGLGGKAVFSVQAEGTATLSYQWRKGGQPIDGANAATYTITSVAESHFGNYDVVVSNSFSDETSAAVTLAAVNWLAEAGNYQGLLAGPDLADPQAHPRPGRVTASISKSGKLTGKLEYLGGKHAFKATLDANLAAENVTVKRGKATPVIVDLQLDAATDVLHVTVTDGAVGSASMDTPRIPVRPRGVPPAKMGRYTLLLDAIPGPSVNPAAPGYLCLSVAKNGSATWKGKMPDGGAVKGSAWLAGDDTIAFYSGMYSSRAPQAGTIGGPLAIVDTTIGGEVAWHKPPQLKGAFWPGGLSAFLSAQGVVFVPPARSTPVMASLPPLRLTLAGPIEGEFGVTVTPQNKFIFELNDKKLKLTVNRATGAMKGSFYDATARKTRKLEGVLLQGENSGAGFYLGTDTAGSWDLETP